MKQIIQQHSELPVILANELPTYPVIGFEIEGRENSKGWLQSNDESGDTFRALTVNGGVSRAYGFCHQQTIEKWIKWGNTGVVKAKMYLFGSEKELFKWLSE